MARRRISRKEIKQPDQFISFTAQAFEWLRNNLQLLIYSLCGVLIVVGLVFGWMSWQRHRRQQAMVLLYDAIKHLNDTDTPDSAAARQEARTGLQIVVDDYGRTPAATQAYWYLGHLYFAEGDYPAALTAYEQAQRLLPPDLQLLLPALVTLDLAYAQEATDACEKALASYETVLQSTALWLHGEAYLGMGRCHEHRGAEDQAIALYERAQADANVDETTRQAIQARLEHLQPPAPAPKAETAAPVQEPEQTPQAETVTPSQTQKPETKTETVVPDPEAGQTSQTETVVPSPTQEPETRMPDEAQEPKTTTSDQAQESQSESVAPSHEVEQTLQTETATPSPAQEPETRTSESNQVQKPQTETVKP